MRRRELLAFVCGAALAWASDAPAQVGSEDVSLQEFDPDDPNAPDIFAIVARSRWAARDLTFSFPVDKTPYGDPEFYVFEGADGVIKRPLEEDFRPFTPELQEATRKALAMYAAVADLNFTEIAPDEGPWPHGDLRFGMTVPPDGRAFGFAPGLSIAINGDVWLPFARPDGGGNIITVSWFPVPGNKDFFTVLHEIGHALGLRHDSGVEPGESTAPTPSGMLPGHDGWDYTIMSYNSYPGGDESFAYTPHTPMIADVAAVQFLYGANFNHNSGDTVYKWNFGSGETFIDGVSQGEVYIPYIYLTLWDGGGEDSFDFSDFPTNVRVDLRPGEWSTPDESQVIVHGTDEAGNPVRARGSIANPLLFMGDKRSLIEKARGGNGDDRFIGNQANNVFTGKNGDDTFFYTGGNDTFDGGFKDDVGDTANFSLSPVSVRIFPVKSTLTLRLREPRVVTIFDGTPLADSAGHSYRVTGKRVGPGLVAKVLGSLHGIENLTGSPFDDEITGDGDPNIIDGDGGDDIISGGGGGDTFVFRIGSGNDVVKDFGGGDRIDLNAFGTSFIAFDDDKDGRVEPGEGGDGITVELSRDDLVLLFKNGSVRVENVNVLLSRDLVF
jgi:serralysin